MNGTMKRTGMWMLLKTAFTNAAMWGAILVFMASCSIFFSNLDPAEPGNLTVSFGSGARTILPDFSSLVDSVSVTISASGQTSRTGSADGVGGSVSFADLAATTWTIDVSALSSDGTELGAGSASVTMNSGASQSVAVRISYSGFDFGTGNLSMTLGWPSSTAVDYLSWYVDSGSATDAAVAVDSSGYTAILTESGLSAGPHILHLSFKRGGSGGSPAGNFTEAVDIFKDQTSSSWIDSSGTVQDTMEFSDSDFFSSNANLGNLVIQDESTSGSIIDIGFSSSTINYAAASLPSSGSIVVTPTESVEGQYISYTWNDGDSTAIASGDSTGQLSLAASPSVNTLVVTVLAPDHATSKVYTIEVESGAATVTIDTNTSYTGLGFASTASVEQGRIFTLETTNATLNAISSGWRWYLDEVEQMTQTGPTFTLSPDETSIMLGAYRVSASIASGGVTYTGNQVLSITRRAALSLVGSKEEAQLTDSDGAPFSCSMPVAVTTDGTVSTLAGGESTGYLDATIGTDALFTEPACLTSDGTYLYVADAGNDAIRKIDIATGAVTTLATGLNSPLGITTDGTYLYVSDTDDVNSDTGEIHEIKISTGDVATLIQSASDFYPRGLATDGSYLYIADKAAKSIRKYKLSTGERSTVASWPSDSASDPRDITIYGSTLYLVDVGDNTIYTIQ